MEQQTAAEWDDKQSLGAELNQPKLEEFIKGFKFRYRGNVYCWLQGDGDYVVPIEYDKSLLEDELSLGYITRY